MFSFHALKPYTSEANTKTLKQLNRIYTESKRLENLGIAQMLTYLPIQLSKYNKIKLSLYLEKREENDEKLTVWICFKCSNKEIHVKDSIKPNA